MVIEAGVISGYLIAWAARKVRRAAGRLDSEADAVLDASLDRLHAAVETRLSGHPALVQLVAEAEQSGQVSEPTRQQIEQVLTEAVSDDDAFGQTVADLVARLEETTRSAGPVAAGTGSAVLTGDVHASAKAGGFAFGQVSGGVQVSREPGDPLAPGRRGH